MENSAGPRDRIGEYCIVTVDDRRPSIFLAANWSFGMSHPRRVSLYPESRTTLNAGSERWRRGAGYAHPPQGSEIELALCDADRQMRL